MFEGRFHEMVAICLRPGECKEESALLPHRARVRVHMACAPARLPNNVSVHGLGGIQEFDMFHFLSPAPCRQFDLHLSPRCKVALKHRDAEGETTWPGHSKKRTGQNTGLESLSPVSGGGHLSPKMRAHRRASGR